MASVDNRVVQMSFDNSKFESNAKQTQETLRKLDESLAFKNGAKGLQDVEAAGNRMNFGPLSSAVEGITMKFDALGIMGVTALMNITNKAVDAGLALAKSLTIEPIITGFEEYELKMNSIQTILTNTKSKGTTLDDVNKSLEELNRYADQTIYNFGEMTRNIGTFTAAGIELEPATKAIKGIANLAAGSGSTAAQAATAMYQLSQALAEGRVSLQTWNSVVNAGMGGELFQHELIRQSYRHANITKETMEALLSGQESFRDALMIKPGKGSILDIGTRELMAAFEKFADDPDLIKAATRVRTLTMLISTMQESVQSGWAQSWEYILGDMDEAATFLTEINDAFGEIVGKQADARNELLHGWKVLGGRDDLLQAFRNIGSAIMSIVTPISDAFNSIFAPMTAFDLANITDQFKNFTAGLIISEETSKNLKTTFEGLFAIFDIIGKVIGAVIDVIASLVGAVLPAGDGFLAFTAKVAESIIAFNTFLETSELLNVASSKIGEVLKNLASLVGSVFDGIINTIKLFAEQGEDAFSNVSELWSNRFEGFAKVGERVSVVFQFLAGVFDTIISAAKNAWSILTSVVTQLFDKLGEVFGEASFTPVLDLVNGGIFASLLLAIKKFFGDMGGAVEGFSKIGEGFTKLLSGVGDSLEAFTLKVKSEALRNIAVSIGILAASLLVISFIDQEKLVSSLAALAGLFTELFGILTIFQRLGLAGGLQLSTLGLGLISISSAVLVLSFAMKNLSGLDWDGVAKGLVGMAGAMIELMGIAKLMGMLNVSGVRGAASYVIFAAAMLILTKAIEPLAKLSWEDLAKGLIGLGVAMLEIVAFSKLATKISISSSISIVILASSLLILAEAVGRFGEMDLPSMIKGLSGVGVVLLELVAFTRLMGNNSAILQTSVGMIAIAASMHIFASAIQKLGAMDLISLGKGLLAMGVALAEVTIALNFLPRDSVIKAMGLIVTAGAMVVLSKAMKNFGALSWGEIARGLVALGGALTVLAVALNFMTGAIGGAAALTIATVGLYGLVGVMKILGTMSWEDIGQSLVTLAGALAALVGAAALTMLVIPGMLALSGALLALGAAAVLVGGGIALLGVGLAAIAVGGAASINLLIQAARGLIDLLPHLFKRLGEAIVELANVVIEGAPALGKALVELVRATLTTAGDIIPMLAEFIFKLVDELLGVLVTYIPSIVDKLVDLIIGIIDAIIPRVPEIISKGVELIKAILDGISNAATGFTVDQLSLAFLELTAAFFLLSNIPITGALTAIANLGIGGLAVILAALGGLQQIPGLRWLISEGSVLLGEIGRGIGLFVGSIVGGFGEGMTSSMPAIATSLSEFMTNLKPFLEGLKLVNEDTVMSVLSLAGMVIALTAASFLDAVASWITGGSSIVKFGEDLAAFAPNLKVYSDAVKGIDSSAIQASANAAKLLTEFANNVPNSGGVVGWFMGENSLAAFAEELIAFAPSLKEFAKEVKGISADSVSGAVNAAKILADFSATIPNQGGIAAWLSGDNSMTDFAADLATMGPSLKQFSKDIKGIDPGLISSAGTAAKVLAEMANNLPEVGGVVGWFSGEASLTAFGEELASFGPHFARYAASVRQINPETVVASATAAKALAEMAATLPEQGGVVDWFTGSTTLSAFGEELVKFGPYLTEYSQSVVGVHQGAVNASIAAANVVKEFAETLPNQGGALAWFTGDNTLSKFGEELAKFGPYLTEYSQSVVGVHQGAVEAAVASASIMASLAEGLPNQGGVVAWFTGDNTLSAFGEELAVFGPFLTAYSQSVVGVHLGAVEASAAAAEIMSSFAETLPDQGGIVDWFTGSNTLSKFGEELAAFGPYLMQYSQSVVGVHLGAVESSVVAAQALKTIGEGLQNEGGLVSLFTGDNTLLNFGENVVAFGNALVSYSQSVVGLNHTAMTSAFDRMVELANMANILSTTDWGKITQFSVSMENLGKVSIEEFSNAFISEKPRVEQIVLEFIYNMLHVIEGQTEIFKSGAQDIMVNGFVLGISEHGLKSAEAMTKVIQELQRRIDEATLPTYQKVETLITNSFVKAIQDATTEVRETFSKLMGDALTVIKGYVNSFKQAGNQLALGLKQGLLDKAKEIADAARKIVEDALRAANAAADVNSPSRETYWTGQMIVLGLLNALKDNQHAARDSARQLAESTLLGLNSAFSDSPTLTVTPVLDMNELTKQTDLLKTSLADSSGTLTLASKAMSGPSSVYADQTNQNGSGLLGGFNFVQNNYSPQALTRAEIYRQTHNLLSTAKGAVAAT